MPDIDGSTSLSADSFRRTVGFNSQDDRAIDCSDSIATTPSRKGGIYSAALSAAMKGALCNDATRPIGGALSSVGIKELSSSTSRVAEDQVRLISRHLFKKLSRLSSADLGLGSRFAAIADVVADYPEKRPKDYCDALNRILFVGSHYVSEEAKSALLRYTTFLDDRLDLSQVTKVLISALNSESEIQATAAARTLAEIGDIGAMPAIQMCIRSSKNRRVTVEMEKAVRDIGRSNALAKVP